MKKYGYYGNKGLNRSHPLYYIYYSFWLNFTLLLSFNVRFVHRKWYPTLPNIFIVFGTHWQTFTTYIHSERYLTDFYWEVCKQNTKIYFRSWLMIPMANRTQHMFSYIFCVKIKKFGLFSGNNQQNFAKGFTSSESMVA